MSEWYVEMKKLSLGMTSFVLTVSLVLYAKDLPVQQVTLDTSREVKIALQQVQFKVRRSLKLLLFKVGDGLCLSDFT